MKNKKRYIINEVGDYIPVEENKFFIEKDGDYYREEEPEEEIKPKEK